MKKLRNTSVYSQPSFYRFSRDSIELAELAFSFEKDNKSLSVLELFAGSGVVSIEFENRHKSISQITFVEYQIEFKEHLEKNVGQLDCKYSLFFEDFKEFKSPDVYDVILLNPPYFDSSKSRLGENQRRNLCRFSLNFEFKDIITKLEEKLSKNGSAYICHSEELEEFDNRICRVGDFQGVGLFRFCLNVD